SSQMNALLRQDRSIVTPHPGTTRDAIEEVANIRGIPVRLTDTAGIRKARGRVEEIGVERSRKSLENSELVLHLLDSSRPFTSADLALADQYRSKPAVIVVNKKDLRRQLRLPTEFLTQRVVETSATTGVGLE